jgi:opacity protein-like surface antigen
MKKLIAAALVAAMLGGCATTKDGSGGPTVNAIDWARVLDGAQAAAAAGAAKFCHAKPTLDELANLAIAIAAAHGKSIGKNGEDDKVFANQAADVFCTIAVPVPTSAS